MQSVALNTPPRPKAPHQPRRNQPENHVVSVPSIVLSSWIGQRRNCTDPTVGCPMIGERIPPWPMSFLMTPTMEPSYDCDPFKPEGPLMESPSNPRCIRKLVDSLGRSEEHT